MADTHGARPLPNVGDYQAAMKAVDKVEEPKKAVRPTLPVLVDPQPSADNVEVTIPEARSHFYLYTTGEEGYDMELHIDSVKPQPLTISELNELTDAYDKCAKIAYKMMKEKGVIFNSRLICTKPYTKPYTKPTEAGDYSSKPAGDHQGNLGSSSKSVGSES